MISNTLQYLVIAACDIEASIGSLMKRMIPRGVGIGLRDD